MKKLKMCAIMLTTAMMAASYVNAETLIQNEVELKSCVSTETVCKISQNIEVTTEVEVTGNATLDLNGYSITPDSTLTSDKGVFIVHNGATLTVNDSVGTGKISTSDNLIYVGIALTKTGDDNTNPATLVVNGGKIEGYYYGIAGNGSRHNTNITINDGNIIGMNATGIYHPQIGTLTVNGGTISGNTGIEMRSGTLKVTGGTIIGTYVPVTVNENGSGATSLGAGVAIAQHTTLNEIVVEISGGTLKGYSALYESNPQGNSAEDIAKISIEVTGGAFETINEGTVAVYSENKTAFITGGTFTSNAKDYIATNVVSKKVGYVYVVGTENKVNVTEGTNGTVTVDKTKAVVGETVTITVTPNEGYELTSLKVVDKNGTTVEVADNIFTMPNSDVTVTVTLTKVSTTVETPIIDTEAEVEEVMVGVKESEELEDVLLDSLTETLKDEKQKPLADALNSTSAVIVVEVLPESKDDIKPLLIEEMQKVAGKAQIQTFFDITVAVKNASNGNHIGVIPELTEEIELMVVLPEKLKNEDKTVKRTYYVIRQHDEEIKKLPATLSEDGNSLIFKSDKFSTYALAYEDTAVTPNPQTFDGIGLYVVLGSLSLISLLAIVLNKKKLFN